ncbi:MauE/DoxX family redox-associated membrane protein [Rhizosphaericola mali]|uniref:MauE/DoxX family redox-associated membrane protein n=1 Tax=Rhizosphaericola mali TaxID=2545455 RepID=UPI00389A4008
MFYYFEKITIYLIIFLFVGTGVSKVLNFNTFIDTLNKSPFIPDHFITGVGVAVPVIEFSLVILLIINKTTYLGVSLSFLLMSLFTCYTFFLFNYSPYLPCSCGGIINSLSWKQHIWINLLISLMLLILCLKMPKKSI